MSRSPLLLLTILFLAPTLAADDGAASISAGGIILMKREPRIVMAKEVLQISPTRVTVDYDFRNDSDDTITTEVAFPVPPYSRDELPSQYQGFDNFQLSVEGKAVRFAVETRAFAGRQEISGLLRSLHVDAGSFGHIDNDDDPRSQKQSDLKRLSKVQLAQLVHVSAIDASDSGPLWRVEKKYHWTQTFPARSTIHIRHQYTPVDGNSNTYQTPELTTLCPTTPMLNKLKSIGTSDENPIGLAYVDFILTTANTWKTPIEDFTLIVERPNQHHPKANFVSFCWDGPITQVDDRHFSAHRTNFIPTKELRVGFID